MSEKANNRPTDINGLGGYLAFEAQLAQLFDMYRKLYGCEPSRGVDVVFAAHADRRDWLVDAGELAGDDIAELDEFFWA